MSDWQSDVEALRTDPPRGISFLCVANSARSQIAEGIARSLAANDVTIWSAGSKPTQVRPEAATVLAEIGIDISSHQSEEATHIPAESVGAAVTLWVHERSCQPVNPAPCPLHPETTGRADPEPDRFDRLPVLCAEEECPRFLGAARRIHWGLPHRAVVTDEAGLGAFRLARDELRSRLRAPFAAE